MGWPKGKPRKVVKDFGEMALSGAAAAKEAIAKVPASTHPPYRRRRSKLLEANK